MPKYSNIHDAIRDNERKKCSVKSCRSNRYRISSCCQICCRRKWLWGHPEGRALSKHEYHHEHQMVQAVIEKNLNHDGINHGIDFLNSYLERAGHGGATCLPGSKHAARLYDSNVVAKDLLAVLAAIYMLSGNFHTPVKDHRHLKYLLGNKFIRFVPCHDRVRGTEHRDVGEYLNDNIGVLLLNISNTARKLDEATE